jgi:hypothetical protein
MNNERDICPKCGAYGYRAAEHCAACRCNDLEIKFLPGAFSLVTAEPADSIEDMMDRAAEAMSRRLIRDLFGIEGDIDPDRLKRLGLCYTAHFVENNN